jgi:hypothetical protein
MYLPDAARIVLFQFATIPGLFVGKIMTLIFDRCASSRTIFSDPSEEPLSETIIS